MTAAVNAHTSTADPHTQYLNNTRGDARYRLASATIPESAIDPLIARDTEVTAAVNTHVAAVDPHAQYLNNARGDVRYRLASATVPEGAIDSLIARDSEVIAAITAHTGAADPHIQYLSVSEANSLYLRSDNQIIPGEGSPYNERFLADTNTNVRLVSRRVLSIEMALRRLGLLA